MIKQVLVNLVMLYARSEGKFYLLLAWGKYFTSSRSPATVNYYAKDRVRWNVQFDQNDILMRGSTVLPGAAEHTLLDKDQQR